MIRKIVSPYHCFVITFSFLPEKSRQLAKRGPKTLLLPSPIPKSSQTPPAQDQGAQSAQQSITTTISGPKAPLTISLSLPPQVLSRRAPLLNYWPVSALPQNPGPTIPPSTSHPPKRPSLTGACTHRNTRRDPCSDFAP